MSVDISAQEQDFMCPVCGNEFGVRLDMGSYTEVGPIDGDVCIGYDRAYVHDHTTVLGEGGVARGLDIHVNHEYGDDEASNDISLLRDIMENRGSMSLATLREVCRDMYGEGHAESMVEELLETEDLDIVVINNEW